MGLKQNSGQKFQQVLIKKINHKSNTHEPNPFASLYIYDHFASLVCSSAFLHTPNPEPLSLLEVDGLLRGLEPKAPAWTIQCGLGGETFHPYDFRTEETD